MGATFDRAAVGGVFSAVTEHQEAMIHELWYKADEDISPLAASIITKGESDTDGRGFITRVEYGTGSSASPNFTVAQNKATGTTLGSAALRNRWVSQSSKLEAVAAWDRDTLLQAFAKGPDELFDVVERERKAKIELMRHRLSLWMIEDGYGRVATVQTGSMTTGTETFAASLSTVNRFREGDDVQFFASKTTTTCRGTGGTWNGVWTITGIDPDTGICTVTRPDGTTSDTPYDTDGVRDGDIVCWNGYHQNAAAPSTVAPVCMLGLGAWIPFIAPSSGATFQGINRDGIMQLCGLRYNATSSGLDHAGIFINAAAKAHQYGTKLDAIFTSVQDFAILCRNKDAVKLMEIEMGEYNIGFTGVNVLGGPKGKVPVVPDALVEQGYFYGGPWNDKNLRPVLKHDMELINTDNFDGNEYLRNPTDTGFQQRLFSRGAIIVPGPGKFIAGSGLPTS
jgi:hypothetical protein